MLFFASKSRFREVDMSKVVKIGESRERAKPRQLRQPEVATQLPAADLGDPQQPSPHAMEKSAAATLASRSALPRNF
jgi:hypothetical protein